MAPTPTATPIATPSPIPDPTPQCPAEQIIAPEGPNFGIDSDRFFGGADQPVSAPPIAVRPPTTTLVYDESNLETLKTACAASGCVAVLDDCENTKQVEGIGQLPHGLQVSAVIRSRGLQPICWSAVLAKDLKNAIIGGLRIRGINISITVNVWGEEISTTMIFKEANAFDRMINPGAAHYVDAQSDLSQRSAAGMIQMAATSLLYRVDREGLRGGPRILVYDIVDLIQYAIEQRIFVTYASGNEGADTLPIEPLLATLDRNPYLHIVGSNFAGDGASRALFSGSNGLVTDYAPGVITVEAIPGGYDLNGDDVVDLSYAEVPDSSMEHPGPIVNQVFQDVSLQTIPNFSSLAFRQTNLSPLVQFKLQCCVASILATDPVREIDGVVVKSELQVLFERVYKARRAIDRCIERNVTTQGSYIIAASTLLSGLSTAASVLPMWNVEFGDYYAVDVRSGADGLLYLTAGDYRIVPGTDFLIYSPGKEYEGKLDGVDQLRGTSFAAPWLLGALLSGGAS